MPFLSMDKVGSLVLFLLYLLLHFVIVICASFFCITITCNVLGCSVLVIYHHCNGIYENSGFSFHFTNIDVPFLAE